MSYGSEGLAIAGEGSLSGGRFVIPDPPLVLRDLEAQLTFDETTLTLSDLNAHVGGGRVRGKGTVDVADVNNPIIDFEASAETVRLQLMEGVRGQISGAVRFQGQEKNYRLSGNLSVSQGLVTRSFTKDFDDSERRLVAFQNPSVEQGPRRVINLNLSLATPEDVRLDTDKARVEAGATLRLTGTVDSPELSGVMSLRPDGSLMVGRNSFRVISARVDFDGFPRSPPALQASAVTKVGETVIQLEVDGEPNDLNIRLRAPENSSLTEGDLMSLLVTGRTLEDAGEGGQQIASTWAMSSFANLIHEGLGDVFSFGTPAAAGPLVLAEERNPTSRMTLGLPLTERFSITYSLPLDDPERGSRSPILCRWTTRRTNFGFWIIASQRTCGFVAYKKAGPITPSASITGSSLAESESWRSRSREVVARRRRGTWAVSPSVETTLYRKTSFERG